MGKYLNTMIKAVSMYQSAVEPSKKPGTKVEGEVADPNEITAEKAYGATNTVDTSASDAMQEPSTFTGLGNLLVLALMLVVVRRLVSKLTTSMVLAGYTKLLHTR